MFCLQLCVLVCVWLVYGLWPAGVPKMSVAAPRCRSASQRSGCHRFTTLLRKQTSCMPSKGSDQHSLLELLLAYGDTALQVAHPPPIAVVSQIRNNICFFNPARTQTQFRQDCDLNDEATTAHCSLLFAHARRSKR